MQDRSFKEKKEMQGREDSLSKMGDDVEDEDLSTENDKCNVEGDEPEENLADTILKADGSSDGLWGSQEWMTAVDEIEGGM
ncbi:unnamed protein product [Linum trigynum]|uniref:Uncharacterized protein n=1 Tax=Linum trigynum TaxID=586398 RepID=A0AAV2EQX6_9ROSI